jgi:hypothetical protein
LQQWYPLIDGRRQVQSTKTIPGHPSITGALEEVIAAGETSGQPNDGYGTNYGGTVAISPQFPEYVGQQNVQFTANQLAGLTRNPQLFVPIGGGLYSSAFGRYQITNGTANQFGFTNWTPAGQDDAAAVLLANAQAIVPAMQGNFEVAMWRMNDVWTSMPDGSEARLTMDQANQVFQNALASLPECQ